MAGVALGRVGGWYLRSRPAKALTVVVAVIGAYLAVFGMPGTAAFLPYRIDLDVYRLGGEALLHGNDLYGRLPDTRVGANLPFTYPPIAALLFAPFAVMPYWLANLVFSVGTVVCLAVVVRLVVRQCLGVEGVDLRWLTLGCSSLLIWLGPVRDTVNFGQVNVFLMTLVVVDFLGGRGRWWQGSLVGLALAIKLTPAVFLAAFLMQRSWRALATGVVSALIYTGIGFAVQPAASLRYWTEILADPSRIGDLSFVSNQSINGALVRLGLSDGGGPIWFGACAVIGIGLLVVMWQLSRRSEDSAVMLAMAFFALVASPVSWSHHWVWAAPALILVAVRAYELRSGWMWLLAGAGWVVFGVSVIWLVPHEAGRELTWSWWEQVVGNAQLIWGCLFLVSLAFLAWRPRREG